MDGYDFLALILFWSFPFFLIIFMSIREKHDTKKYQEYLKANGNKKVLNKSILSQQDPCFKQKLDKIYDLIEKKL